MNKKIVIISGGELEEEFVLSILEKEENQYVIGVDKGMEFLYSHQILSLIHISEPTRPY